MRSDLLDHGGLANPAANVVRGWKARRVFGYSAGTVRDHGKDAPMRISNALFAVAVFCSPSVPCLAQAPSNGTDPTSTPASTSAPPVTSPPAAPAAPAPLPPPSGLLASSLDSVRQTLGSLRVERWKRGSVRDEASEDINSIMTDMQTNLPTLMKDADGGPPGSLSKVLPLAKHVNALYDVLLRVVEAARMAAPDDQANALRDALNNLSTARFALDDRMQQTAALEEKQVADLRVTVERQAAFKCPAPPPPPECPKPPVKKPVRRKPTATAGEHPSSPANQQKPAPSGTTPQAPQPKPQQKPNGQQQPANQKTNP
jgi:hypothetical protein